MRVQIPSVLSAITRFAAKNAGVVTLLNVNTALVSIDLGLLVAGQLLVVSANVSGAKGATLGDVGLQLSRSAGTGILWFNGDSVNAPLTINAVPVGAAWGQQLTAIGLVNTSGPYTLLLDGYSLGSNSTVGIGSAQLGVLRFNR